MSNLKPDNAPLVCLIVVNWNGRHFLTKCLSSLRQQNYSPYEIILVDNGSTDGSVDFVIQNFPQVRLVQLSENLGFAGGNTKGLEVSKGEYIGLLNNDTHADEKWLENIIQPMIDDPTVWHLRLATSD